MRLPYVSSISRRRWRLLGHRYPSLFPHLHVAYDYCTVDDDAWRDGTPQRGAAVAHIHEGTAELSWLGLVILAHWPADGPPRRAWRWPDADEWRARADRFLALVIAALLSPLSTLTVSGRTRPFKGKGTHA